MTKPVASLVFTFALVTTLMLNVAPLPADEGRVHFPTSKDFITMFVRSAPSS